MKLPGGALVHWVMEDPADSISLTQGQIYTLMITAIALMPFIFGLIVGLV